MSLKTDSNEKVAATKYEQPLTFIAGIYEEMVKQIDPAYLVHPEKLEFAPLTKEVMNKEGASLHSVSKIIAFSLPNKIFIKQSWGGFKEVQPDLLIQIYSILIEAKNKVPEGIISNSIPHIIILSENQKMKNKIEIVLWQQLFEKGDIFLGRRACLHQKRIPPISVYDCNTQLLGEEKQDIDLGSYWAGYIASYALADNKDILEVYCTFLSALLSDRVINFPVH
jgi:hypothetical protein